MTTTRTTVWVDFNGRTRATILTGNASLSGVESALQGLSNASVQRSWEGSQAGASGTSAAAAYQNVADYAALTYQDGSGNLVYITLVAPQASIFLADGETVDPTAIAVLSAAVIGTVQTAAGGLVTAYVGGVRRRSGREYQ